MANIVVTSDTKWVKAEFNDLAVPTGILAGYFSKEHIAEVLCRQKEGFVEVRMDNGDRWPVSFELSDEAFIVDSVDGVTPTDNGHLMDMIAAFIDY